MTKTWIHHLSFEFFPPKTDEGLQKLIFKAQNLAKLKPEYFSVTFGAGGSTKDFTYYTVQALLKNCHTPIAPHLTCVGLTQIQIKQIIQNYADLSLKKIVALRGDVPSGMGSTNGDFRYAADLVKFINKNFPQHFNIAVAAYPEFHPQSADPIKDILNLKQKIDAGAASVITQYFFNTDGYFSFLDLCAKHGINIPIVPGIMPINKFSQLLNFSDRCGAEVPLWLKKRLAAFKDDQRAIIDFGVDYMSDLCAKLIANHAPGLHFYTLNKIESSVKILQNLHSFEQPLEKTKKETSVLI